MCDTRVPVQTYARRLAGVGLRSAHMPEKISDRVRAGKRRAKQLVMRITVEADVFKIWKRAFLSKLGMRTIASRRLAQYRAGPTSISTR